MKDSPRPPLRSLLLGCAIAIAAGVAAYGQQTQLTFAVFGDCRPGGNRPHAEALPALAADMAGQRPSFLLGTGDYIDGSSNQQTLREQWRGFFKGLQPLQQHGAVSIAFAPGNHDILGSRTNQALYEQYFKHRYRSFNRGPCHFVVLDTEEPGKQGRIAGEQLKWLQRDLAQFAAQPLKFVVLHRPLYPVDGHRGSSLDEFPQERDALHRLFLDSKINCVFAGHEHLYNRQVIDGIEYIITGGGGAPLYAKPDKGGFHHYILVRVNGTKYEMQLRRLR